MFKGHSPFSKTTRILAKLLIFGVILGSYTNAFVFAVVGNIPFTMEFIENTVEDMPDNILDGLTPGTSSLIPSNNPIRSGFKFGGWCDQPTTKSGNNDTCASGHSYQPGGTISLNQTGANNIKLYAMWEEVYTMQQFAAGTANTTCSAMSTGDTISLIDSRDEIEYLVGKLADDKCWMLDNLALDLTNSTVLSGMTQDNTNASNTTLGYLKGTTTGTTSDQYATAAVSNWTSSHSYSAPLVSMADKDKTAPTGTSSDPKQSLATSDNWKYGGYYNYCAASAGSYCYGNGTSAGTSSGNATEDICPKGWRMPTGNSGEYQTLYSNTNYNTYDKYREALRLPLSGYFDNGSADYQGSGGGWWSSTRDYNYYMYSLNAGTSGIYPANSSNRRYGYSVRCVLGS